MTTPITVDDALNELKAYHQARSRRYVELLQQAKDERTSLLLQELIKLERESVQIIADEQAGLGGRDQTHLRRGPGPLQHDTHAPHCRCDATPTFDEAVACALAKNEAADELIDRIESATAAESIRELAGRLRDLERIKSQQIAKFLRED